MREPGEASWGGSLTLLLRFHSRPEECASATERERERESTMRWVGARGGEREATEIKPSHPPPLPTYDADVNFRFLLMMLMSTFGSRRSPSLGQSRRSSGPRSVGFGVQG